MLFRSDPVTTLTPEAITTWHRRLCHVTPWLVISGDLPQRHNLAVKKLDEWVAAGVTDIVDVRGEWSDARLVASIAPELRYHYLGTHDDGSEQSDEWFHDGLTALHTARQNPDARILVHCHMGVNRGPSMAFAYLLDQGWEPLDALDAIRASRPIAGIIYAADALRALTPIRTAAGTARADDAERVEQWLTDNEIDISAIIHRIRVTGKIGRAHV